MTRMNQLIPSLLSIVLLTGYLSTAYAVEQVKLVGLFGNKAVLEIDGAQHILKKGQASPEGVTFIEADGETAVLEVNGQRARYKMGGAISLQFNEPTTTRKQIYADHRGMFHTVGSINGYTVNFLVDTGATTIAMNANQARRLGLDFRLQGELTQAQTASGVARAYYLKLDTVKVGDISQRNVDALVIDGTHPREVLLGMSFLNRLKVEKQGNVLHLEHRR